MITEQSIDDYPLLAYVESLSVNETQAQRNLRAQVSHLELSHMQISPLQAQFIKLLISITNPKKCLEIGTYCGFSSLVIAEAMAEDGILHTCDNNAKPVRYAKRAWYEAEVDHKIVFHLGPALNTLKSMKSQEPFDLIFIDADKTNYCNYYKLSKQLIKKGGIILVDNILWQGKVVDCTLQDRQTNAIRAFNQLVKNDKDVVTSILPLGDGFFIIHVLNP